MSGLPAALPGMAAVSLGLVGDLDDWHQLDHYTATFVVLDAEERPVALTLQQHNYLRTHLVGESVEPGRDGRFDIDVAIRSNELYPHAPERRRRRAVRFPSPEAMAFMMGFGKRPLMSADDVTDPDRTVDFELAFLPGADAFYTFHGYLGERRLLPGRDGPPGARYNTLPRLKPLPAQILGGYWREGTRATGSGTAAAGSAATTRASFPARRRRCSIATWPACGGGWRAARCSDAMQRPRLGRRVCPGWRGRAKGQPEPWSGTPAWLRSPFRPGMILRAARTP